MLPTPAGVDVIITMLPSPEHVREVYCGRNGILKAEGAYSVDMCMHRQMQAHCWDRAAALIPLNRYVDHEALDCMAPDLAALL